MTALYIPEITPDMDRLTALLCLRQVRLAHGARQGGRRVSPAP